MNLEAKILTQVTEAEVKQIQKVFGKSMVLKRGLRPYSFNLDTMKLQEITLEKKSIEAHILPKAPVIKDKKTGRKLPTYLKDVDTGDPLVQMRETVHHQARLDDEKNAICFCALNMESAKKRLNKLIGRDLEWSDTPH